MAPAAAALIVAHRALDDGPSSSVGNSIAAIERAAAAGADAVELDVRATRDHALVLAHDPVQWQRGPRVVRWSGRKALSGLTGLDEGLAAVHAVGLAVKLDVKDARALAAIAARCRAANADLRQIALWCRSPSAIAALPERELFAEIALLADHQNEVAYPAAAHACGANAVSLNPGTITARAVTNAHALGLTVYAWIRSPDEHASALAAGVDGLVTDWTAAAHAAIAQRS